MTGPIAQPIPASWRCHASRLARLAPLGVLILHALLVGDTARRNFVTIDESAHIPSGIAHWRTGDFSMYRVNPPLPRMLATLAPHLVADPDMAWITPWPGPGARAEMFHARRFATNNADDYLRILFLARLAGIAWSVGGGWLVFTWARALYGGPGAWIALIVWCFEPNVIANAAMATPDLPAAVAGLFACRVFWEYLKAPSWSCALAAGVALGLAELTKFTWLILYVVWPALALLWRWRRGGATVPRPGWSAWVAQGGALVLTSLLVINAGYGFSGSFAKLKDFQFISQTLTKGTVSVAGVLGTGNRWDGHWLGEMRVPLPAEFLKGLDQQRREFEVGYPSYLRGEWRDRGWWYYYLYAIVVKVPIGFLALGLAGVALACLGRRGGPGWRDELVLLAPAVTILAVVSSQTGFNHHLRYVLPAFPLLIVLTGRLGGLLAPGRRLGSGLIVGALAWGVISSVRVHPHELSYFNEAAGGPANGSAHLVDSNIDWGQDLLELKRWLDQHPEARPLRLAYYNLIDPRVVGVDFTLAPPFPIRRDVTGHPSDGRPDPGYYAVSVNFLRGSAFTAPDGQGGLHQVAAGNYAGFGQLRPIAWAGYSIAIYRVEGTSAPVGRGQ